MTKTVLRRYRKNDIMVLVGVLRINLYYKWAFKMSSNLSISNLIANI